MLFGRSNSFLPLWIPIHFYLLNSVYSWNPVRKGLINPSVKTTRSKWVSYEKTSRHISYRGFFPAGVWFHCLFRILSLQMDDPFQSVARFVVSEVTQRLIGEVKSPLAAGETIFHFFFLYPTFSLVGCLCFSSTCISPTSMWRAMPSWLCGIFWLGTSPSLLTWEVVDISTPGVFIKGGGVSNDLLGIIDGGVKWKNVSVVMGGFFATFCY